MCNSNMFNAQNSQCPRLIQIAFDILFSILFTYNFTPFAAFVYSYTLAAIRDGTQLCLISYFVFIKFSLDGAEYHEFRVFLAFYDNLPQRLIIPVLLFNRNLYVHISDVCPKLFPFPFG